MKTVKFSSEFSFKLSDRVTKTWPAGWPFDMDGREVPTPVAHAARRAGACVFAGEDAEKSEAEFQQLEAERKAKEEAQAAVEIPDDWKSFNAADTVELAKKLGAGDDVATKAQAADFIAAEIAKRGALL
jgi:hypothetical protein